MDSPFHSRLCELEHAASFAWQKVSDKDVIPLTMTAEANADEPPSYYKILNVAQDATLDEIKRKYRQLSLRFHPDKNPAGVERVVSTHPFLPYL